MRKRFWWLSLTCALIVGGFIWRMSAPVVSLEVYTEPDKQRRFCHTLTPDETVAYLSINSIYRVPVTEEWRVTGERIYVTRVLSAPSVLDYYGIADYYVGVDGLASGEPGLSYDRLRIKLTEQGQQRLRIGDRELELWALAPAGVLTIQPRSTPRWLACRGAA